MNRCAGHCVPATLALPSTGRNPAALHDFDPLLAVGPIDGQAPAGVEPLPVDLFTSIVLSTFWHAANRYGKIPYYCPGAAMTTAARFDLKMDADEKAIVAKAAALMGTTMAGFVRAAAKEKAQVLLEREARVTLSGRDFSAFARALDSAFAPNPALKSALTQARRKVRRA